MYPIKKPDASDDIDSGSSLNVAGELGGRDVVAGDLAEYLVVLIILFLLSLHLLR